MRQLTPLISKICTPKVSCQLAGHIQIAIIEK